MHKFVKHKTAADIVRKCFNRKHVPSDAAIIEMVKKANPDSKFNQTMLSWYKSRARQGKLFGVNKLSLKDGRKNG